jgi:two-component system, LytTR family, sensor kinase
VSRRGLHMPLSSFWTLQLAGWSGFFVAMALSRLGQFPLDYMVVSKGVLTLLGVAASLGLRALLRPMLQQRRPLGQLIATSVVASYLLAAVWTALFQLSSLVTAPLMLGAAVRTPSLAWLFLGTVYHAFSLVAWAFLYLGIKHHRAWQDERERALRAESAATVARLQALQSQLNPHFFFNTLNAISTLVVEHRNEEATSMIARLGHLLRATLKQDAMARVALADELDYAQRYLDIEQVRFGDRLRVRCEVEQDAYGAAVPLLLLQPLLENAIRHGIARKPTGGEIVIAARLVDGGKAPHLEPTPPTLPAWD